MSRTCEVRAPSRLHFGMFSFGRSDRPQFGGLGVMIEQPQLHLRVSSAAEWGTSGPGGDRALTAARRVCEQLQIDARWQLDVLAAPPAHAGFGSGTQLAMALTAAFLALHDEPPPSVERWLTLSGRGKRSMIGVYGFLHGGLIVEWGKSATQPVSPLAAQVALPTDWRFVLITPPTSGLHGDAERVAFDKLPPVADAVSDELLRLAEHELLPAARQGAFLPFRDALERFNELAGSCFSSVQGGHYAPAAQRVIDELRRLGVRGYAQTSWGPTVAVLCESAASAESLSSTWRERHSDRVQISAPANAGALVTCGL